jgi:hypothetical protein
VNHSAQRCGGKQKSVMIAIKKNNTTKRKKRAKRFLLINQSTECSAAVGFTES